MLARPFRVFAYDRRARGDSGDTPAYAVGREVEDLEALIEEAGGSAQVWGMSSGAALALEAAASGLRIAKLALYEPPFIVDDSRPPIPHDYISRLNGMLTEERRGDAVKLFLREMGAPRIVIALMRFLPRWSRLEAVAHTLPYDATILRGTQDGRPLPAERWRSVTMPTLVIVGGKSPKWFHNGTRALAHVLPNAQHLVLEGQTHNVKAKPLAPILEQFFAS